MTIRLTRRATLASAAAAGLAAVGARPATASSSGRGRPTTPGHPRPATPGRFTTHDGYIYAPNGQLFVPIGANMAMPYSYNNAGDVALGMSDEVQRWGWNAIRLPVTAAERIHFDPSPDWYANMLAAIDAVVAEYTAKKIVVVVDSHALYDIDKWNGAPTEADVAEVDRYWHDVATAHAGNPYVWFNLDNELPGGDPEWFKQVTNRHIDIVRSVAPHNIILAGAMTWGQDLDLWGARLVTDADMGPAFYQRANGNLVIDVHFYGGWGRRTTVADQVAYYDKLHALGLPLVIGETGYDFTSTSDASRQNREATMAAIATAAPHGVGIFFWNAQHVIDNFTLVQKDGKGVGFQHAGEPGHTLTPAGQAFWDLTHDAHGNPLRNPRWMK